MSLFDFAVDFGLTFFKDTSNKSTVTRKEYRKNDIDFYTQSLEQSTGIGVDTTKEAGEKKVEEESINLNTIGTPEQDSGENPNVLDFQQTSGSNNIVSNAFSSDFSNTPSDLLARTKTSYGEALKKEGFKDRAPMNFLGTDYFFAGVPTSLDAAGKNVKKGLFSMEGLGKAAAKAVGFNSIATGLALGFAKGKGVPDAMGNNSFRPDHFALGAFYDINASNQYADVAINQAALASYTGSGMSNQFSPTTGYDHVAGRATGFNGYIGGQLVTRAAGSTNYNGVYDLDYQQMKAAEALGKGYIPRTFDINNESGERGVTLANNQGGMYDEKGNYHSLAGSAAAGSMKDARDLAETYFGKGRATGKNVATITKSLQEARDQYGILGGKKVKDPRSLSVIIRDNMRGFSSPEQTIKNKMFESTDPRSSYFKDRREQEFGKNKAEKEAEEKKQADAIAVAEKKSLAAYKAMVAKQQKAGRYDDGSNNDGSQDVSDQASVAEQQGGMFTAKGGFVSKGNFALGGKAEPAGFIEGPPEQFNDQTTIADDIPLTVKDGTFVLNAPAVENEGSPSIQKMLAEGYEKAMTRDIGVDKNFKIGKIPSIGELDIQISRGEVVVPPHVARVIGYDRLEKINNRGKREVERRQKAGNQEKVQAGQGFAAGDKVDAPKPRPNNLSSPYNDMKILGDLDLRADLEKYLYGNPVARIGWELYKNRELDVEAAIPEKETINYPDYNVYGVYGHYVSQQNLKRYKANDRIGETDKHYMENLDPKINERTKPVVKFRSGNYGVGKLATLWNDKTNEEQLRILTHELSHAGINFLDTLRNRDKKTNKQMTNYEESLIRAGDSLIKKRTGLNVYNKRGINTTSYESHVQGKRQLKWDEQRWLKTSRFAQDVLRKMGKPDEATTSDDHRTWGRKFKNMLGLENKNRNKFNYLGFGTDSYDLDAQGESDVDSQDAQNFSDGGFVRKAAGWGEQFGVTVQPITRKQGTITSFKNFLKKSKPLRSDIEQFIDTIPGDKSRLGILAGVEAPLASSTLPELEAIIQTILNRVDDTTYEYRNINTIKDIMKQRSSRGTGSKMFMYDGLERRHITPRLKEIVQNPKVFQAGLDAAENVLTKGGGEPDYETSMLPKDVFQYSLEGKPSAVNNSNPKLKFYKKIGKHNFYKRIPQ